MFQIYVEIRLIFEYVVKQRSTTFCVGRQSKQYNFRKKQQTDQRAMAGDENVRQFTIRVN